MKLKLAEDLSLPLDAVTEKLAFLGRTGSGKTYAAMKLAELMLAAGAQIGALDPVGVWRALRVPAEKGGASYEVVVFGGLYGDLPLEPTTAAGELVADLVCERGISFVLDVSQFIPAEQQRFVRAFADRFFHRKKSAPSAVHLFMEECQEFIPENPSGQEEQKTLGVMQRLWKLGRNFGIGGSLISQRPQEVAKKALNMSGTMFAFQMTGPHERAAVKKWVADQGIAFDIESVLQKLDIGQPHVESPMFLEVSKTVRILPRVTADLSSTPKVGASTAAKRPLTPIDVEKLKTSMSATIEKAKADDPRELRRQIADLAKEHGKVAHKQQIVAQPKVVEKPVLKDGQLARLEKLYERIFNEAERHAKAIELFWKQQSDEAKALLNVLAMVAGEQQPFKPADVVPIRNNQPTQREVREDQRHRHAPVMPSQGRRVPPAAGTSRPASLVSPDGPLPPGELAVLTAALTYPDGLDKKRLGVLTGYKKSSRDAYIARLTLKGLTETRDTLLYPTAAGRAALNGTFEPLPTGAALVEYWRRRLPGGEREVFEVVVAAVDDIARDVIDTKTGYKKSSRDAYLARLKARGVVCFPEPGIVRASDELFD